MLPTSDINATKLQLHEYRGVGEVLCVSARGAGHSSPVITITAATTATGTTTPTSGTSQAAFSATSSGRRSTTAGPATRLSRHTLIQPVIAYRSADGSGNNTFDATLNAAGTEFGRIGDAHFADGISEPLGGNNPRTISNLVVGAGDAGVANPEGVSAFMYAWGQFIDHDMTLTRSDNVHHIDIVIPNGDPILPDGSVIAMTRAVIDPTTGAGTSNPALAVNTTTGWLDASMVYGWNAHDHREPAAAPTAT